MAAIDEICDLKRLRKSNDLAFKWFSRTGLSKNAYLNWVIQCWKNPDNFKQTLTPPMRSAFAKDIKNMFYAAEVENDIIKQYENMIPYILQKIRHDHNMFEDLKAHGLHAIRNCCWQYRTVRARFVSQCGFTTFCHNSIFLRIRSEISKVKALKNRRNKKFTISTESHMGKTFSLSNFESISLKEDSFAEQEKDALFNTLISRAQLDEQEKFLLDCLVARTEIDNNSELKVWYTPYLQKYRHTFPKGKISREGMRLRVLKLQRKLWFHLNAVHNLPQTEMPHFSMR